MDSLATGHPVAAILPTAGGMLKKQNLRAVEKGLRAPRGTKLPSAIIAGQIAVQEKENQLCPSRSANFPRHDGQPQAVAGVTSSYGD